LIGRVEEPELTAAGPQRGGDEALSGGVDDTDGRGATGESVVGWVNREQLLPREGRGQGRGLCLQGNGGEPGDRRAHGSAGPPRGAGKLCN
jgi:hypothetical protein